MVITLSFFVVPEATQSYVGNYPPKGENQLNSKLKYVPPEDGHNTKIKKNSKHTGKKSADNAEQGKEVGVVGAVDDAEQEQGGVAPQF